MNYVKDITESFTL